jgi:hypothetical protein
MRVLIGGLLGLCLLASMPTESQARGDARAAVQSSRPAAPARIAPQPSRAAPVRSAVAPAGGAARQPALAARGASRQAASAASPRGGSRQPALASRGASGRFEAAPGRGRQLAAVPYGRPMTQAPAAYRQSAMASCTIRSGRRVCTSGATRSVALRWGSDLGSPTMAQSSCPDGTIATIAIGHTNVVRCVPL